jgi:hypothetical protein
MASNPIPEIFNSLFSSARSLIEQIDKILKARSSSLRGIGVQIKKMNTNIWFWWALKSFIFDHFHSLKQDFDKLLKTFRQDKILQ